MSTAVTIERIGATALVRLDRKKNKNALSQEIMLELTRVAEQFADDREISTVILTGSSTEFSAGVDLKDPARWQIDATDIEGMRIASSRGARMCKAWEDIPQITIAAIEGLNVGGGIALALACDWRVQSDSALMMLPEAKIGIPLSWQTIPRLVNIVGASKAKQIVLLGDSMNSQQALELGLIDFIAPASQVVDAALALAQKVNQNSRFVTTLTKQAINNYANALNHLATHMDVDQAVLSGMTQTASQVRQGFQK